MNQQQRRYAVQRIQDIETRKTAEIEKAFNDKPENKAIKKPNHQYTDVHECAKALVGNSTQYTLKTKKEIEAVISQGRVSCLDQLFNTSYSKELAEYQAQKVAMEERKKIQVDKKVLAISTDAKNTVDIIIFGDNTEVLKAIKKFEEKTY